MQSEFKSICKRNYLGENKGFFTLSDSELKSMVCTNAECISISLSMKIGDCDTDQDK